MQRLRHITGGRQSLEAASLLAVMLGFCLAAYPSLIKLYREVAAAPPARRHPPDFVRPVKRFAPSFVHIYSVYPPAAKHSHKGIGSGFIISRAGRIVTNNHLVEHADKIIIKLADRRELDGKCTGLWSRFGNFKSRNRSARAHRCGLRLTRRGWPPRGGVEVSNAYALN